MVKVIIYAFDHMELCLLINLTKGSNWAFQWAPISATGYVSFAILLFIPGSKLLPAKKLISDTENITK